MIQIDGCDYRYIGINAINGIQTPTQSHLQYDQIKDC